MWSEETSLGRSVWCVSCGWCTDFIYCTIMHIETETEKGPCQHMEKFTFQQTWRHKIIYIYIYIYNLYLKGNTLPRHYKDQFIFLWESHKTQHRWFCKHVHLLILNKVVRIFTTVNQVFKFPKASVEYMLSFGVPLRWSQLESTKMWHISSSISGPTTAVAVFRNPNTFPFCLSILTDIKIYIFSPRTIKTYCVGAVPHFAWAR
jgi:hypothetical protein